MVNLMLTYHCNMNCDFCFAKGQNKLFPQEMSIENLNKVLNWFEKGEAGRQLPQQRRKKISLLGGEPTLHSKFLEIIDLLRQRGFKTTIFSNGIFPSEYIKHLDHNVINGFVINYNPEKHYTKENYKRVHENLRLLSEQKYPIKLSYNISPTNYDPGYIFKACKEYNINVLRFCIASPNIDQSNVFAEYKDYRKLIKKMIEFVKEAKKKKIKLTFDCCMPWCLLTKEELLIIKKYSQIFKGTCDPPADINPDLSVYYCLPQSWVKVKNVTDFGSVDDMLKYFKEHTNKIRWEYDTFIECKDCIYKKRKMCQGGCLAMKEKFGYTATGKRLSNKDFFKEDSLQQQKADTKEEITALKKIGIRIWGGIGDGMMFSPTLRKIKQLNPSMKIYCVGGKNHREIFENSPYIDKFTISPDNSAFEGDFDKAYSTNYRILEPSLNFKKHGIDIIAEELFGIKLDEDEKRIDVFLEKEDEQFAKRVISKHKNPVILAISSQTSTNQEWDIQKWKELVSRFDDYTFIQLGVQGEPHVMGSINMLGKTTVRQAVALVKYAKLFVGVDSFLNHATNATATPGVVLFGNSTPVIWGYKSNTNIYRGFSCQPCVDKEGGLEPCSHKKCLNDINVDEVYYAVRAKLREPVAKMLAAGEMQK